MNTAFNEKDISELKKRYSYFPETGLLVWKIRICNAIKVGQLAGHLNNKGYIRIQFKNKNYLAHRIIWAIYYGQNPDSFIDHIDGNKSNNIISNLRLATKSENNQNQKNAHCNNKLKILGVYFKKGLKINPFVAQIRYNKKAIHIGCYPTVELAYNAYLEKKQQLHHSFVKSCN